MLKHAGWSLQLVRPLHNRTRFPLSRALCLFVVFFCVFLGSFLKDRWQTIGDLCAVWGERPSREMRTEKREIKDEKSGERQRERKENERKAR